MAPEQPGSFMTGTMSTSMGTGMIAGAATTAGAPDGVAAGEAGMTAGAAIIAGALDGAAAVGAGIIAGAATTVGDLTGVRAMQEAARNGAAFAFYAAVSGDGIGVEMLR